MKSYKVNEADAVFSESINITETTDTNHADNINAAPKEIFENTVALNREVKAIKKNMEEESGESIGYNNESSGLNAENLQEAVDELAGKANALENGYDNAGYHNSVFRGKYLGTSVTAEQHAQIAAGTFKGLYIGDYWTINGVNWRIAHFDYWLRTGDTECTKHHIVVVPDTNLYTARMNATNVTTGGYFGSEMKTTNLAQAETIVKAAFGADKILTVRRLFVNAVANGKPSNGSWYDSTVDLMTEGMAYGANWFTPACDGSTVPYLYTTDFKQLALFALAPSFICNRNWYWLQNVVSAAYFANVVSLGYADYGRASHVYGVRPASAII